MTFWLIPAVTVLAQVVVLTHFFFVARPRRQAEELVREDRRREMEIAQYIKRAIEEALQMGRTVGCVLRTGPDEYGGYLVSVYTEKEEPLLHVRVQLRPEAPQSQLFFNLAKKRQQGSGRISEANIQAVVVAIKNYIQAIGFQTVS